MNETINIHFAGLIMAKEKFTRTKPHVNVGSLRNLGFSMTGATQIANGSPMTVREDRELLLDLLADATSQHSQSKGIRWSQVNKASHIN